jgi:hypothetical protein
MESADFFARNEKIVARNDGKVARYGRQMKGTPQTFSHVTMEISVLAR